MEKKPRVVLVLKPEYKGKIITRMIPRIGEMEFDTRKVPATEYERYRKRGFDVFDEVEQVEATPEEIAAHKAEIEEENRKAAEAADEEEEEAEEEESEEEDAAEEEEEVEEEAKAPEAPKTANAPFKPRSGNRKK